MTVRLPAVVRNVYADLRDRRLLPLAGVSLLAIIVTPFVLRNDVESPTASLPAEAGSVDAPTVPAVVVSEPGLRDYRERLESLRSKNPFEQNFEPPDAGDAAVKDVSGAGSASAGAEVAAASTSSVGGDTTGGGASGSVSATTSTSSSPPVSTTTDGASGGSGSGGTDRVPMTFRIDVEVGPAGDTERRRDVKLLTVLPSQSNPVALFLGAAEGGKQAVFLVSEDVTESHGDGSCVPTQVDCQFLNLKPGDVRKLEYAPKGKPDTFVIKLVDIKLVPIKKDRKTGGDDSAGGRRGNETRNGLEAWLGL